MRRDNQDVMGEKPVKNNAGQLSLDEDHAKRAAWNTVGKQTPCGLSFVYT